MNLREREIGRKEKVAEEDSLAGGEDEIVLESIP